MDNVFELMRRHFEDREEQSCRSCKCKWKPKDWNFYGLCDACFSVWNSVRVRMPPPGTYTHVTPEKGYYTSCEQWLADGCPPKPEEPFQIHWKQ